MMPHEAPLLSALCNAGGFRRTVPGPERSGGTARLVSFRAGGRFHRPQRHRHGRLAGPPRGQARLSAGPRRPSRFRRRHSREILGHQCVQRPRCPSQRACRASRRPLRQVRGEPGAAAQVHAPRPAAGNPRAVRLPRLDRVAREAVGLFLRHAGRPGAFTPAGRTSIPTGFRQRTASASWPTTRS